MRGRLALVGLLTMSLTTACRISGSEQVEEVDADLLGGLDEPSAETSTPEGSEPPPSSMLGTTTSIPTMTVRLYFIEGSQLRAVDVETAVDTSVRGQLSLLEDGPPAEFAETGVRTALVPGLITGVARWGSAGARVTLDSDLFGGVDDADQRLMVGQIVLTLADQPDIDQVDFTLDGEPLQVFDRENTLSEPGEAVGRDDYEMLLVDTSTATVDSSRATTEASRSSVSLNSGP